ncbi:ribbon-helix-helix domain-containing protein [Candidatus Bipolaricaulota bacterium]|nr:ribbon-helix-helix domain-containing protein [Candidatus Bipolaricaulota bacterium]
MEALKPLSQETKIPQAELLRQAVGFLVGAIAEQLGAFGIYQTTRYEFNPLRLKMRIVFVPELFIDVFYSARTQRIDFALIEETERIFGVDNLNG